jgi:hypothetical protein
VRRQKLPKDALDQFIEARIDRFLDVLRQKIGNVEEIDTAHDPEHRPDPQDVI